MVHVLMMLIEDKYTQTIIFDVLERIDLDSYDAFPK